MEKQEFIEKLKITLNGRVSPSVVMDNVRFYEDYINTEIRKGRNPQEVLDTLGDPRLIAKTIVETNHQDSEDVQEGSFREAGYEDKSTSYSGTYGDFGAQGNGRRRVMRIPGWAWLIAVILVIVIVLGAIFSVISFLMPILLPVILVVFLVKLFRDWLN